MKYPFVLFLCATLLRFAEAQPTPIEQQQNLMSVTIGNTAFREVDYRVTEVDGSPMFMDNFLPGRIFMEKGQEVHYNQINYDAHTDELIVLKDKHEAVVTTTMVRAFDLFANGDTISFVKGLHAGKLAYFESVYKGKSLKLLRKYWKTFKEGDPGGSYRPRTNASFKLSDQYFVQNGNEPPKEFKSKKQLLEALPEFQNSIEKISKEQKTNFKDESDIVKLFTAIE